FAIDLDQYAELSTRVNIRSDRAFGSHTIGTLLELCDSILAQPRRRFFKVALGFGECFLAVHHSGASLFAEFFDYFCVNLHRSSARVLRWVLGGLDPSRLSPLGERMVSAGPGG